MTPSPALAPCLSLADYVAGLIGELGEAEPDALARMRRIVGQRRARIQLDDEAVDAWFSPDGRFRLAAAAQADHVDGTGYTDRATVLDLLGGYLEVTGAVRSGRLAVVGKAGDVVRMFQAIEILLDAAPRTPRLQKLAIDFQVDPCREDRLAPRPADTPRHEHDLLQRLGMLPHRQNP